MKKQISIKISKNSTKNIYTHTNGNVPCRAGRRGHAGRRPSDGARRRGRAARRRAGEAARATKHLRREGVRAGGPEGCAGGKWARVDFKTLFRQCIKLIQNI